MLEKFLNKEVKIEEKIYNAPSTHLMATNEITGIMTAIYDDFIELDNTSLIAKQFIYRIRLK